MTGLGFGLIMFLCLVPALWITFFCMYPKNWRERKLVLGVNNRPEFQADPAADEVEKIVQKSRRNARTINMICTLIAAVLLLLRGFAMMTFVWTCFIFIAIFVSMVPFIFGHRDMMAIKRKLGIVSEKGVSFVDLKTAGSVHALKTSRVILPIVVGLAAVVFSFLADLGVIRPGDDTLAGTFGRTITLAGTLERTITLGSFWLMGILIVFMAYAMDNMKNTVISTDSDINANYNRAKKKSWADMNVGFLWAGTIYMLLMAVLLFVRYSEMLMIVGMGIYLVVLMAELAVFVSVTSKIDARYQKEISVISDDDEYWIGGMIYYNPNDKRAMVEKHAGIGTTVNFAHPVGKITAVFLAISIVVTILSIVWIGMLESTPIRLRIEKNQLICHQLRDEYVIPMRTITTVEFGEDITQHSVIRSAGVGMESLLKGNFVVDQQSGCKVFLDPTQKVFLHIVTDDGTSYYIGGATASETQMVYDELKK